MSDRPFRVWATAMGWRWECRVCPPRNGRLVGGLNKNDKWLAPWSPQRDTHPRIRCLAAIKRHCWERHWEEGRSASSSDSGVR